MVPGQERAARRKEREEQERRRRGPGDGEEETVREEEAEPRGAAEKGDQPQGLHAPNLRPAPSEC